MNNRKPINVRLDDRMDARLDTASKETGLPKADIFRTALALGLKDLELMKYDIEGAIYDRVLLEKSRLRLPLASVPQPKAPAVKKKA